MIHVSRSFTSLFPNKIDKETCFYVSILISMQTHHSSNAHSCDLSKAVQYCVISVYYLGQMQCLHTKINSSAPLTHGITSTSKLRKSHFGIFKKTKKSRVYVFCLPVCQLLFRYNFDSCDATPNTILGRTTSLCNLKNGVV